MRHATLQLLAAVTLASVAVASPSPQPIDNVEEVESVALHHPHPDYPLDARRLRLTGRGIVVGLVDPKTGILKSVKMEQSTGHGILDDAALRAFRQWRFRPGTIRQFRFPVTYTIGRRPRWPFVAAPLH